MKALILLLLSLTKLLSTPDISTFTLPEDTFHFSYFLQKSFAKKQQNVTIISSHFDLPKLSSIIIKNKNTIFNIYVQRSTKQIEKLALYHHVRINMCQNIQFSQIHTRYFSLRSLHALTFSQLSNHKEIIKIEAKNMIPLRLPKNCQDY